MLRGLPQPTPTLIAHSQAVGAAPRATSCSYGAAAATAPHTTQHRTQYHYGSYLQTAHAPRRHVVAQTGSSRAESREVKQGGVSRPAPTEPAPRPASTRRRHCRRRSLTRSLRCWPRSQQLCGPCRQQPGRELQRGGFSRPAPADPVTPLARTSLRRCGRCGKSCLSRRTPRQLSLIHI